MTPKNTPKCYKCKSDKYVRLKRRPDGEGMKYEVWYCEKCRQDA